MKHAREDYDRRIVDLDNKIPHDEPVFLLRGQDILAPGLLLEWAKQLRLHGGDPNMARTAEDHAQAMIDWQRDHGAKTPDMHNESAERKSWKVKLLSLLENETKVNFPEMQKLFDKIYGNGDKLYIFTAAELKTPTDSLEDIILDNLVVEDEDRFEESRLAIFIGPRFWKVIKQNIN